MRIISRRILREFWEKHPDAKIALQTWFHDVERATWNTPADIKAVDRNIQLSIWGKPDLRFTTRYLMNQRQNFIE